MLCFCEDIVLLEVGQEVSGSEGVAGLGVEAGSDPLDLFVCEILCRGGVAWREGGREGGREGVRERGRGEKREGGGGRQGREGEGWGKEGETLKQYIHCSD